MPDDWETLDTEKVIRRQRDQNEQTTSAGVGGYERPLGSPVRPPVAPYTAVPPKKPSKKKSKE